MLRRSRALQEVARRKRRTDWRVLWATLSRSRLVVTARSEIYLKNGFNIIPSKFWSSIIPTLLGIIFLITITFSPDKNLVVEKHPEFKMQFICSLTKTNRLQVLLWLTILWDNIMFPLISDAETDPIDIFSDVSFLQYSCQSSYQPWPALAFSTWYISS